MLKPQTQKADNSILSVPPHDFKAEKPRKSSKFSSYSIGIRQKEKGYEVAADWWAIETFTGQKQEEQRYSGRAGCKREFTDNSQAVGLRER